MASIAKTKRVLKENIPKLDAPGSLRKRWSTIV